MRQFAVIGLGNFGFFLAKKLHELGKEVIAIDIDKDKMEAKIKLVFFGRDTEIDLPLAQIKKI